MQSPIERMVRGDDSVKAGAPVRVLRQIGGRRLFPVLALLVVACCAPAIGDDKKEIKESSLEELMNIRVYSASKHLQSTSEAPSSVSVITHDDIQKYGYRTLAEILRSVRGFYISYDRNYSYLGVRGVLRLGDFNNRVLLLIDGHRINNNIYDQAMIGSEFAVDVDMIERVEVIRGPSSSLYGGNAFFAVVNVITRKSQDIHGLELSFEPGSFGTYKGRSTYGGEFRKVNFVFSGTFSESAGQNLFFEEFNSPATNNGVAMHADDTSYRDLLGTVSFHGFTLQVVSSYREKGIPDAAVHLCGRANSCGSFDTVFNDSRTRNIDRQQYVDVSYEHPMADKWRMTLRTFFDQHRYDALYVYATGDVSGPAEVLNKDLGHGTWTGGELKLDRSFQKQKLTFGTDLRYNLQQDQVNYDVNPYLLFINSHHTSFNWAFYGQDEFAITSKFTVNAGLRFDRYYSFGGTTNPRLGLIYRPLEKTTVKLLFGDAFRPPNAYEQYYAGAGLSEGNLRLHPETIQSSEAVVEQMLGQHYRISGSVFHNKIDHLITQELDPANGLLVFQNSEKARATGTEFELNARFAGMQGSVSYNFTQAENGVTNRSLANSPKHLGKLNFSAPLGTPHLFGSVDAQYESLRVTEGAGVVGGFPIVNLTLFSPQVQKHVALAASIYNLLDKRYAFPAGQLLEPPFVQDGRNFRLKMTVHF